jgi:glycosyltransferase involved in cell wall biosynthesis
VPPKDSKALAVAIHSLLSDEKLRRECSRKARERAQHYSWDHSAEKLEVEYQEVVNS